MTAGEKKVAEEVLEKFIEKNKISKELQETLRAAIETWTFREFIWILDYYGK